MIRNADGRPFKLLGTYSQFNPEAKAHDLFNRFDQEIIKIGGTPIFYYEVMIQTQTVDPIYMEDRSKLFSPCPVQLYAYYEPPDQANPSGLFGIDTPDAEVLFELNYKATLEAIGHPPKIGSRIFTPHLNENWIIIDYKLGQYQLWGAIRLQLQCKHFQETATDVPIVQSQTDFNTVPNP